VKKILLIGDSIPITPKIGSYVMLLENKYGKENIENLCISGNGIKEIMRLIKKVNFNEYENIIFHFGIVDSAPRTMGQKLTKFVSYIRPLFIRNIYLRYVKKNRKKILENQSKRIFYTDIGKFEILFRKLLNLLPQNKNIIFINITNEEERVNTIISSARIYNQSYNLIIDLAKAFGFKVLDLYELSSEAMLKGEDIFMDGLHYNKYGHKVIFNKIKGNF
jgi:hypothetical protein